MLLLSFLKKNKLQKFIFLSFALLNTVFSLPNIPTVVNGVVDFSKDENSLSISCSDRSIINWNAFSIAAGERVSFTQPSAKSFVLNRVIGTDQSQIFGSLNSNGVLFLLNPNGILIGQSGQIDVGSFIASTLNLSDSAFINNDEFTFLGESKASIVNLGNIKSAKDVFLISKQIDNENQIDASGKIGFGAGLNILLKPNEDHSIYILAGIADEKEDFGINDQGILKASEIEIKADGNLYKLAINDSSTMDATSLEEANGEIYLVAKNGNIKIDGSKIAAKKGNNGGTVEVLADVVEIQKDSKIDASNTENGGVINIGCLNDDVLSRSKEILINESVVIDASCQKNGKGGSIKITSDENASILGNIYVNPKEGDGSSGEITIESEKLNCRATIENNMLTPYVGILKINTAEALIQDEIVNDKTTISPVFLNQALQNYNVEINTKNETFTNGNVTVNGDLEWSKESCLKLVSDEIYINGKIINNESYKYHDSLVAAAKRVDINSNINAGYNNILITLDAAENNILNVNEGLFGCVSINALGKNNSFYINVNPSMYAMKIDGGSLTESINVLINTHCSSKWTINSDYEGNLGAISFKNINSIQGAANDDIFISAKMKEVMLKENNNATITGTIDLLTVDSNCCNIDIQDGYVKEINNLNGKNIYFLNGGIVDRIACQNGNDYFYFSNGDVSDSINVDQANAYFNFTYNASIHANINGGSKITQLNYYIYNSPINVDLNTNIATGVIGSISNINSIIGDKKYFGSISFPNNSNICKSNGKYSGIINDTIYFSNISQINANGDNLFEIHGYLNSIAGGNNNIYNFYSD
ncbi:MAG: filamentous hemagglutinin N-terminal domain-containing protein, partial [Parachlamydiales bacterium]